MEQGNSGEYQYLFDQMDEILAAATDGQLDESIREAASRDALYERQEMIVESIAALLDEESAGLFQKLYEPNRHGRIMAAEVSDTLLRSLSDRNLKDSELHTAFFLDGLNNVVWMASRAAASGGELSYESVYLKAETQLDILEEREFSSALKAQLIRLVDEVMPGKPLDLTDPDAFVAALVERHRGVEDPALKQQRNILVEYEFAKYEVSRDDPEYRILLGLVKTFVNGNYRPDDLVALVDGRESLRVLGISHEQFIGSVNAIYSRLKQLK